jgi:hypothetical protein
MSRRLVVSLAAGLVLGVAAPPAGAKEVQQALACGADGCRDITAQVGHDESVLQTGGFVDGPTRRAPFYRIRLTVGEGNAHATWHVLYVPSQHIVGSVDESTGRRVWSQAPYGHSRVRRASRGLRPLPARRLPMPTRDERLVRGALPPEVVPAPADAPGAPAEGGVAWALLAPALGLGGAGMLLGTRAARRRRRR